MTLVLTSRPPTPGIRPCLGPHSPGSRLLFWPPQRAWGKGREACKWGGPLPPRDPWGHPRLGAGLPASRPPASPSPAEPTAQAPVLPVTREGACGVPGGELRVRGPECGPGGECRGRRDRQPEARALRDQQGRREGGGLMGGGRHGDPVQGQDAAPSRPLACPSLWADPH